MAKKKVEVEIDVESNLEGSIAELKELKKQLRETAAGSDEFKKLYNQIDDLEDKIKASKNASKDWIDSLESAGGPLGMVGAQLNKLKVATQTFGGALKATGIGLVVSLLAGLAAAFNNNEGAMKKLQPLLIGFQKIFQGIFRAIEPVFNSLVDLATSALPMVTNAFGVVYSALSSFLQGIGGIGQAVYKLITGDFKGAWESASEAVTGFGKRYDESKKNFIAGTKELTSTEKEELDKRKKANDEAAKAAYETKKADLEARIKMELNSANTERSILEKLYKEKNELDDKQNKLTKAQRQLRAEEQKKEIDAAIQYDKDQKEKARLEAIAAGEKKLAEEIKLLNDANQKKVDAAEHNYEKLKIIYGEDAENVRQALQKKNQIQLEMLQEELTLLARREAEGKVLTEKELDRIAALQKAIGAQGLVILQTNQAIIDSNTKREVSAIETQMTELDELIKSNKISYQEKLDANDKEVALVEDRYERELKAAGKNNTLIEAAQKKHNDSLKKLSAERIQIEQTEKERKAQITSSYINLVAQFGNFLQQIAGKNKELAIAGLVIEQAAAVARIIVDTAQANAKAVAAFPVTLGQPFVTINTISAALGIASAIAATAKGIAQINQASTSGGLSAPLPNTESGSNSSSNQSTINVVSRASGGVVRGEGSETSDSIPARLSDGEFVVNARSTRRFQPLLNAINLYGTQPQANFAVGGPVTKEKQDNSSITDLVGSLSESLSSAPIKTYVSAVEISNQQQFERVIKSRSLI